MNESTKEIKLFWFLLIVISAGATGLFCIANMQKIDSETIVWMYMCGPAVSVLLSYYLVRKKKPDSYSQLYILYFVCFAILNILMIMGIVEKDFVVYYNICGSFLFFFGYFIFKKKIVDLGKFFSYSNFIYIIIFVILFFGVNYLERGLLGIEKNFFVKILNYETIYGILNIPFAFFLNFNIIFGEEYAWRGKVHLRFMQKMGERLGTLIFGLIWAGWHFPICRFAYSPSNWLKSFFIQVIVCIMLSAYLGIVILKTKSIWTAIIIHFLNNIILVMSNEEIYYQIISWQEVFSVFVSYMLILGGCFLLLKRSKDKGGIEKMKKHE